MEELKFSTYQDTLCNYKVFIVNTLYGKPHYTYYKWAIDKYKIPYNLSWTMCDCLRHDNYIKKMEGNLPLEYDEDDIHVFYPNGKKTINIYDVRRKCEMKFPL